MKVFQTVLCVALLTVSVARAAAVAEASTNGSGVNEVDYEVSENGEPAVANAQAGHVSQGYHQLPYPYVEYVSHLSPMPHEQASKIIAQIQQYQQQMAATQQSAAQYVPQYPPIHPALYNQYIQQYPNYAQLPHQLAPQYPQVPQTQYVPQIPQYPQLLQQYPQYQQHYSSQYPANVIPYSG